MQEIACAEKLRHRNVCALRETIVSKTHIYLISELCTGGEVFEKLNSIKDGTCTDGGEIGPAGVFPEKEAATIVRQMLEGVGYMHSEGFVHRDLKPENFLFAEPWDRGTGRDVTVKLIDFGGRAQL